MVTSGERRQEGSGCGCKRAPGGILVMTVFSSLVVATVTPGCGIVLEFYKMLPLGETE